ncbi:MAG TPA: hypothetical protein VLG27_03015, partial [Candidatus Saccharimonadia bacterium]|nr:hypothetical protein [Candidatus Saccharimonadia bacterium]
DSLAIWAFGSLPAYTSAANAWLKQQGLAATMVGSDASGYNPSTVSTAADLVRIGEMAMQDPVLAGIIGQTSAAGIPMAGTIKNVNLLVGTNNVVGVKTGNTDQAGGVFVGAIRTDVNQKPVTVVTALVGSPTLFQSMKDSLPLMQSAIANFQTDTPIHANQTLGSYKVPWGGTIQVKAARNLALTTWNGATITASLKLPSISVSATTNQPVGSVTATEPATSATSTQDVNLASTPKPPTLTWRLTHP